MASDRYFLGAIEKQLCHTGTMVSSLDTGIIIGYLILINIIGSWNRKSESVAGYLLNSRNTNLFMLVCSTAATIAGAGAVVGTSAEAGRTGISYGIITALALSTNMLIYCWLVPKIREACDGSGINTPSDLVLQRYGSVTHKMLSSAYALIAMTWTAVQFLAVGNLFVSLFGLTFPISLLIAYVVIVIYTALGGLLSDIISDFLNSGSS